jgi:hypothetical protein
MVAQCALGLGMMIVAAMLAGLAPLIPLPWEP